ncbi:hypothetical protein GCM10025859_25120 [Alicyclobacillus fastidiosus]|nr:hypothetical protein GCM10025859_25120 [Alicyclobacillus fastidiosus]
MGPKTSDAPQQPWMGAFDYKTLGAEVDFLMLMTYEWGWVGLGWVSTDGDRSD